MNRIMPESRSPPHHSENDEGEFSRSGRHTPVQAAIANSPVFGRTHGAVDGFGILEGR